MKQTIDAVKTEAGIIPRHAIEVVCQACGYDLDEAELAADTCSDCGEPLRLKQSVAIEVTTLPPVLGASM